MLAKPLVPLTIMRDLKCCHCQEFISCGPIHSIPDKGVLCGRCRSIAKPTYHNKAFEALATTYSYPCKYWQDHCDYHLNWGESLEHEENCSYNGCCTMCCAHPGAVCSSKRKFPNTEDVQSVMVSDVVLEQIRCVYCYQFLSCEPVYLQADGSNVCHRCTNNNGPLRNSTRNLPFEKLAANAIFPCIYRSQGCTTKLRFGRTLWHHEANCSYGVRVARVPSNRQTNLQNPNNDNNDNNNGKIVKKKMNEKERGVIQTQWGHDYGTIVDRAFAPPINGNTGYTADLIKSLKQKQHKERLRIEEMNGFRGYDDNSESSSANLDQFSDESPYQRHEQPISTQPRPNHRQPADNYRPQRDSFREESQPPQRPSFRQNYPAAGGYYAPHRDSFRDERHLPVKTSFRDHYPPAVHSNRPKEEIYFAPSHLRRPNVSRQSSMNSGYSMGGRQGQLLDEVRANKLYKNDSITERNEPFRHNNYNPNNRY